MLDLQISTATENKAIVIGGSIAGLLAAQVLTKYFDRVIIVERDRFPEQPEQRQGVPQAYHVHVLLIRGQQILEQLFPGILPAQKYKGRARCTSHKISKIIPQLCNAQNPCRDVAMQRL